MATEGGETGGVSELGPPGAPDGFAVAIPGEPAPAPAPRIRWGMAAGLLAASVLGTAALMPYTITLLRQAKDSPIQPGMVPVVVVMSIFIEGAMSASAIAIGIALGGRAGLGPFLLDGVDGPTVGSPGRAWRAIGLASAIGVVLGAVIVGASYGLRTSMPATATSIVQPSPVEGLLASIGAGIREEVWLRLGLMTLLACLGAVIARRGAGSPSMIWTANVLAALAFGAMHLPQAAMLIGLNAAVVGFVFIGNGVPGIAFGWLYWRKGLVAAMVAHFLLDVVLKVILPAVTA